MSGPSPTRFTKLMGIAVVLLMMAPTGAVFAGDGGPETRSNGEGIEPGLEYVAIAPSHLARYLAPLIEWKNDRGVPAQIFNLEVILSVYAGRDDAERVHNFLQDLFYNLTDGSVQWLLLGGDADRVPVRYLWANRDHTGNVKRSRNLYVGDMYYSGLGSDWDADKDMVFGEPGEEDASPELFVGRIPASLPEELEAAVAKDLAYEMDPPSGDWFENVFLAGALMDEPNYVDDPFTMPTENGGTDEGFDPYTDNAFEATQKVRAVMGEDYDFIELADYPVFEGCGYSYLVDTLSQESARAAWRRGNSMVFMASHGYEAFGGLAQYEGNGYQGMFDAASPYITWEDTAMPDTGGMLPLVYMSSCYSGQFDKVDSTNFESAITVAEGGAIAVIAGDGDTFRLENISVRSFGNWWLSERFWQLVIDEGMVRPGEALGTLKEEYYRYYLTEGPPASDFINMDYFYSNLYAYNLMGDPEVPVWTGTPNRLALEVLGGGVLNAPTTVVRVTDAETGEGLAGATVFARGAGLPAPVEAVTDEAGVTVLEGAPTELGGELRLATTLDGHVPARHLRDIVEGVRDLSLTDEGVIGPKSMPFSGQVVSYNVTVINTGDFSAAGVSVRLESGDHNAPDEEGVDGRYQTRAMDVAPGTTATLTLHHRYTAPGQYVLSFEVDPDGRLDEADEGNNRADVTLILLPMPGLPDSVGPIEVIAGQVHGNPLDLDFYVEMPNGFPKRVAFTLGEVTDGVGAWIDAGNNLLVRPDDDASGSATVTVVMTSEGVLADEMTVLLDIRRPNRAPVVNAIGDQEVAEGDELAIAINASDGDDDPLVLTTDLAGATISEGILRWTPSQGMAGVQFPTVTAVDGKGGSTTVRFRLAVLGSNVPPRFQGIEDEVSVEEGSRAFVPVRATDPDGDRLTFALARAGGGFSIDAATGLLTFDASNVGDGTHTAIVVVSDGVASVSHTISVEVEGSSGVPMFALVVAGLLLLGVITASFIFRD